MSTRAQKKSRGIREQHRERAGKKFSPEYLAWYAMKQRCYNPNKDKFAYYGGRGIQVCDRWRWSFSAFLADMGRKPTLAHSLDRIDNDGNYTPTNCRWATRQEQRANRRDIKARA